MDTTPMNCDHYVVNIMDHAGIPVNHAHMAQVQGHDAFAGRTPARVAGEGAPWVATHQTPPPWNKRRLLPAFVPGHNPRRTGLITDETNKRTINCGADMATT